MTILFNRALVLAKTESTFDTDAVPVPSTDAFLVAEPNFTPDISLLERNNVRVSLSNDAPVSGRKLARVTFTHEVRNNGNLDGTSETRLGRLLRACGMRVVQRETAAETLLQTIDTTGNVGAASFVCGTAFAQATRRRISILITNATGPVATISAPAQGDLPAISLTGVTLTAATPYDIYDASAGFVASITPTWGGTTTLGDQYDLDFEPLGYYYYPESDNVESLSIYLYLPDDGGNSILHKMTGARGTFQMTAQGGQYGTFQFTFTGSYVDPVDVAYPTTAVYETQRPAQVEFANLKITRRGTDVRTLKAAQFTMDIANDVQIREDVNASEAYAGAMIVARRPVMGFDPEATLEATFPFWAVLSAAESLQFSARVGTAKGNTVIFSADNMVMNGLGYQNRNSIRAYDVRGALNAVEGAGDDEFCLAFV